MANIKIGAETSKFVSEMRLMTNSLKVMDSQFSVLTTKANAFGSSSDKLNAKNKSLTNTLNSNNKILDMQKKIYSSMQGDITKYTAKQGELASKIDATKKKQEEALKTHGKESAEYKKISEELRKLENSYSSNEKSLSKATDNANKYKIKMNETEKEIIKANKALEETNKTLSKLKFDKAGETFEKVGNKMKGVGDKLSLGVSLPLLAIGTNAIKTSADFEKGMSSIESVSNLTGEQLKQVHDLAIQAGKDTAFSAKEAEQGIEELIKAGVSIEDILNGGLISALNLASAGDLELGESAEIASTALNAFAKDNLSVEQAANLLAGGANASATNVQELKLGLSACSAVASGAGLSFKDTTTALSLFANSGLKGSDAGTSLKTMISNLIPKTDKQAAMFEKLGLNAGKLGSSFYDTNGKIKSMEEISGLLHEKLGKLSDGQRQVALQTMFGSDAIRAGNILYEQGAEGVKKLYGEMSKTTAQETASKKLDNLSGSVEQLGGTFETLKIKMLEGKNSGLRAFVDGINDMLQGFMNLSPQMQNFILTTGMILIAIGPALSGIGRMATGLGALSRAFGFIKGLEFGKMFSPLVGGLGKLGGLISGAVTAIAGFLGISVGAFVAIAAAVAIAVTLIVMNWTKIKTWFAGFWEWIKVKFNELKIWTGNLINGIGQIFMKIVNIISIPFKIAFMAVKFVIENAVIIITGIIKGLAFIIETVLSFVWGKIKPYVTEFTGWVSNKIMWLHNSITAIIEAISAWISNKVQWINNAIISPAIDWISNKWQWLSGVLSGIIDGIANWFSNKWQYISGIASSVGDAISNKWQWISGAIHGVIDGIASWFSNKFEWISGIASNVGNKIGNFLMKPIDFLREKWEGFWSWLKGLWDSFRPNIKLPHFSLEGKFDLASLSVPHLAVNWYSAGGIFTRPTVMGGIGVGDANKGFGSNAEAVLPLNKLWEQLGKNFNDLEKKINSNKQPIYVIVNTELDGKEITRKTTKEVTKELDNKIKSKLIGKGRFA